MTSDAASPGRPPASAIESPLLEVARAELSANASYAEPPSLLGDGVTARAYALRLAGTGDDTPLVCRVLCPDATDSPPDTTRVETALHNALAELGAPVPRVLAAGDAGSPLGLPFMLMERAAGRALFGPVIAAVTLATALAATGNVFPLVAVLVSYWAVMVRLLARVHAVPGGAVREALTRAGVDARRLTLGDELDRLEERTRTGGSEAFGPLLEWLRARRPEEPDAPHVCHGDYWMGNVLLGRRGVALLDWSQACLAHREYDLGWIAIQHFSRPPLPFAISDAVYDAIMGLLRPFAWGLLGANGTLYAIGRGIDRERVRYYAAFHCARVLARIGELRAAGRGGPEMNAWGSPRTVRLLCRRLERITGLPFQLPASGGAS